MFSRLLFDSKNWRITASLFGKVKVTSKQLKKSRRASEEESVFLSDIFQHLREYGISVEYGNIDLDNLFNEYAEAVIEPYRLGWMTFFQTLTPKECAQLIIKDCASYKEKVATYLQQDRNSFFCEANQKELYTGKFIDSWPNGKKKTEGNFINGKGEGLFIGWHENGGKQAESIFKNGEKDGLETVWDENGQKFGELNYKNGMLDGLSTTWCENGENLYLSCIMAIDLKHRHSLPVENPFRIFEMDPNPGPMLNQIIRIPILNYQEDGRGPEATGMMIWLHTFTSPFNSEVRHITKKCWPELRRGCHIAEKMLSEAEGMSENDLKLATKICLESPSGFGKS